MIVTEKPPIPGSPATTESRRTAPTTSTRVKLTSLHMRSRQESYVSAQHLSLEELQDTLS